MNIFYKFSGHILLLLILKGLFFTSNTVIAQNVAINEDGTSAHPSAILDVQSPNKGLLIPRVSLVDANNPIGVAKETGLLVFNTASTYDGPGLYFWNGSDWEAISGADADAWLFDGNAISTGDFIGTTNNQALSLRTNNNHAVSIGADATSSVGTNDDGLVNIHNRLVIGNDGPTHPTLNGSLLVGDGAPDIFNGGISLYSKMTTSDHVFQGGIRMHNATTTTNAETGGALLALRGFDLTFQSFGTNGDMRFLTGPSSSSAERMRLANNGRLGIGDFSSINPGAQLHLRGTALNLYLDNPSGNNYTINSTNGGDLRIFRVGGTNFPLTIRSNGNVGINQNNPVQSFHVGGTSYFDGNVGIYTANPEARLHVRSTNASSIDWNLVVQNDNNSPSTGYGSGIKLKNSTFSGAEATKWVGIAAVAGTAWSNRSDLVFYANDNDGGGPFNNPEEILRVRGNGHIIANNGGANNARFGVNVANPDFAIDLPNTAANGIGRARANQWVTYSDKRLKSHRSLLNYGLETVMQLAPQSYFHHNSTHDELGNLVILDEGEFSIGFLAQDLYQTLPELVAKPENDEHSLWSVDYAKLSVVLTKAIQEQQELIEKQQKQIEALEQQNAELSNVHERTESLEAELKLIKELLFSEVSSE